jgi:uncharacterized protein
LLTTDLVRVRRKGDAILPRYLHGPAVERLYPIVRYYAETFEAMIGKSRDDVDASLDACEVSARDRVAALGLRKVLEDRAEFETAEGVDPEALRREVFAASAQAHKGLELKAEFDRAAVLASAAERLGTTVEAIEKGLYADLRGSEVLKGFTALSPAAAIERYNLGLAQAILLRATRVTVELSGEEPARMREIFRAARFHQLLHVVRGSAKQGYVIELDGPYSLFDAVQRYGLRLALFLPSVLSCASFHVKAEVLWGRAEREKLAFEITAADGLVAGGKGPSSGSPDLDAPAFCEAFGKLGSAWKVRQNRRIFALPGEVVCVPDLIFENGETGEEAYLEAFGFWSRAAVWRRVELLRKGFPARILLAVGKQLRVSEEVLGEEDAGEIYVYRRSISPREVLARLDRGPRTESRSASKV